MKRTNVPKKELYLLEDSMKNKVLEQLFKHPDVEYSLTDLAKEAGVSKSNIGGLLDRFYEAGIITITRLTKIWRIRANQESWYFTTSKIVFNLSYIYQTGLVEFINTLYNNPRAIVLFGSFRWGTDVSGSDIDLAVEVDEDVPDGYQTVSLKQVVAKKKTDLDFISQIEEGVDRNIQVHVFSKKFKREMDTNVFHGIVNGIVLGGFLEITNEQAKN